MQVHVHICQRSSIQKSDWVMHKTIEKRWSKEDITTSSNVYFMSSDILNSLSIFCLHKMIFLSMISWALDIWRKSGGRCCFLPTYGRSPSTDLSLYILYVLYVCIIKWSQSPWRMQKPLEYEGRKIPSLLCICLGLFEKALMDSFGTSCTYQTLLPLLPLGLHWLLRNHQNCFIGRAGF